MIKTLLEAVLNASTKDVYIMGSRKSSENFSDESSDLDVMVDCSALEDLQSLEDLSLQVELDIKYFNSKAISKTHSDFIKSKGILLTQELINNIADESLGYIN